MTALDSLDLSGLCATASAVLDSVADRFIDGVGAPSAVDKGGNDFATQVDLDLERIISAEIADRTGIAVHGEEFGGPAVDSETVWVLDPVDGTFNYSAGVPLTGILLALMHDGQPVIGLTWLPLLGRNYAAHGDSPLFCNDEALPALSPTSLPDSVVTFGAFNIDSRGRYPGRWRLDVLGRLSRRVSRIRLFGSTGVDLAFSAAGLVGGTVGFGHHAWDNAAGVFLVRAAGGVATDLAGNPWRVDSPSVLTGDPGVHAELVELIAEAGDPAEHLRQEAGA
ncbi:inositol monophosphatase family protein [Williamsia sterculiae]|uniref:inositol-phosphate phosphatase n=1 Tax=Williamsia sterculiae TaxID=1344003 RepID=A0A1N7H5W7_9NOCA|nr:inositol monophosphatase [Williamsia sterculiae]SIS20239.1 myo-inositol-1(or 4)-monophosphatase [Williamsia sterculiae]